MQVGLHLSPPGLREITRERPGTVRSRQGVSINAGCREWHARSRHRAVWSFCFSFGCAVAVLALSRARPLPQVLHRVRDMWCPCGSGFSREGADTGSSNRSVPNRHQRLHFCFADQALGVSSGKQTSCVGRPDPDASMVFQPLRHKPERLVIHCRWAQCRLTCCIHFYTYSLAREWLIYVSVVTDPRARPGRAI